MSISCPLTPALFLFFFFFVVLFRPLFADDDSRLTPPPAPSLPQPPTPSLTPQNLAPFRPSIAVIIAVLTTVFSITFLLLLYAKHCKRGTDGGGGRGGYYGGQSTNLASVGRKDSGIERTVIESLPLFRFGSLRGQKDGLECSVCLARFEPTELLRLLPKCKHAFHVECVDTWLEAHSTCPLCRYRVDPEDIFLIDDGKILHENQPIRQQQPPPPENETSPNAIEEPSIHIQGSRRVSGRHSSAGEKASGFLEIVVEQPGEQDPDSSSSNNKDNNPVSFRRSLDSSTSLKKKNKSESVTVGCFDRQRKDGLLLADDAGTSSFDRSRFEHRITISGTESGSSGFHQRWSNVHPSDMLYLRSEMIISDNRRFSSQSFGSRRSVRRQIQQQRSNGRSVINSRSVG
ncbi:putative ring finger protein [Tripterygium wilfordii]|uniref:RING-type E3 ubiquitin transferase n=1 Tax=Tripterygium wilfordii TaxID=458696 RepID=A0A7J7CZQ8_TRIWF|nr:putative ring finger protein [Tripterygium wilfordii]